jgi:hypothetical protein
MTFGVGVLRKCNAFSLINQQQSHSDRREESTFIIPFFSILNTLKVIKVIDFLIINPKSKIKNPKSKIQNHLKLNPTPTVPICPIFLEICPLVASAPSICPRLQSNRYSIER